MNQPDALSVTDSLLLSGAFCCTTDDIAGTFLDWHRCLFLRVPVHFHLLPRRNVALREFYRLLILSGIPTQCACSSHWTAVNTLTRPIHVTNYFPPVPQETG